MGVRRWGALWKAIPVRTRLRAWDADTIRESAMEVEGLLTLRRSPEDLPELFRDYLPSELSEQVSLLDVELFEVHPARGSW